MEEKEEGKTRERERQSLQRRKQLQRDQTTSVTNTLVATDAKAVLQRREQAKVQSNRAELLENDIKSSLERSDEVLRRWSEINLSGLPEDIQKDLSEQQQYYTAMIQDKKKIISDLQQKLKLQNDKNMKTLRSNEEEIIAITARMEDQREIVTKAYREELDQTTRLHEKEISILLTKDMEERDRELEKLWKEEVKMLKKRKEKLEEYKKDIHQIHLEQNATSNLTDFEHSSKLRTQERDREKKKMLNRCMKSRLKCQQRTQEIILTSLRNIEDRLLREEREIKKLKRISADRQTQLLKRRKVLSADYKRCIEKYERKKEQIRHFAVADARRFQDVWLMIEAEVKQLAERALAIDSAISHRIFGLPWKQPDLSLLELPSPIRSWKPAPEKIQPVVQKRKSSQGTTDGSAESDIKSSDMTVKTEGAAASVGCGPEWEEEKRSKDLQKEMKELLCNETDFLMDAKLLKLLAPLVDEEQVEVKLGSLLYTLGIEEEDLPELTDFLLKYKQQQSEQTEETCESSVTSSASELIHPNLVLPALKSFLQQRNSKKGSARHLSTLWLAHARNDSKDAAYWESLGNIIPEEKVQMWDAAEKTLKQYHAVLREISDLTLENERLTQKNTKLRAKLNSTQIG